jgi:hypothetical protein
MRKTSKKKDIDPVKLAEWLFVESQRQQKLIRAIIELNDELSSMSRRDPEYRSKLAAFAKMGKEMNKVTPQPI